MNKQKTGFQNPKIKELTTSLLIVQREEKQNTKITKEVKCILLGYNNVGKSSIVNKYLYESLPDDSSYTTEENYTKILK